LAENNAELCENIKKYLEDCGGRVYAYLDGESALNALCNNDFDMVVLETKLPKMDGFSALKEIRAQEPEIPVIFISEITEIEHITKAYTIGCTDYLKKPFHNQELWLRINQVLKLCKKETGFLLIGESLKFDKKRFRLFHGMKEVMLTKKRAQILALLVSHLGLSIPIERFRQFVWERDDIDDATIRTEINRLRKIAPQLCIKNIKGVGYKLERFNNLAV
jgi:DNA-binding response OmpR family regulator